MPSGRLPDDKSVDLLTEAYRLNPQAFEEMAALVYGEDAAWEMVSKASAEELKRQKRQAQIGLASNVVGITAGAASTGAAVRQYKNIKRNPKSPDASPFVKPMLKKIHNSKRVPGFLKKLPKTPGAKIAVAGAAGAAALQATNLGGDFVANRVLARESKKKVEKRLGSFTRVNQGVVWKGEISKRDDDKRQVFGWASVVEVGGQPVVDHQDDLIPVEVIEKAAYEYVKKSRKGGDMHRRMGDAPLHVSDMIESFLVTPEKKAAMGLPDDVPTGWWVGFQVNDEETWQMVKRGERTEFSIHGTGRRVSKMLEEM